MYVCMYVCMYVGIIDKTQVVSKFCQEVRAFLLSDIKIIIDIHACHLWVIHIPHCRCFSYEHMPNNYRVLDS
jgi:hypothetical protein